MKFGLLMYIIICLIYFIYYNKSIKIDDNCDMELKIVNYIRIVPMVLFNIILAFIFSMIIFGMFESKFNFNSILTILLSLDFIILFIFIVISKYKVIVLNNKIYYYGLYKISVFDISNISEIINKKHGIIIYVDSDKYYINNNLDNYIKFIDLLKSNKKLK